MLQEILDRLNKLPEEDRQRLIQDTLEATKGMKWVPNPGPQTEAYLSPADTLLYGGQAAGGKSGLIIGLSLTAHHRSLVMRRQYGQLRAIIDETLKFHGTREGFNAQPPPVLRTTDGRTIEFGAANLVGDEEAFQGQPHDLVAFDEVVHFAESQVRFLMGWNRPSHGSPEGQRCRVVMASNPPVTAEGQWVVGMFRPWLDITHTKPAKPGELRWFITAPDGSDLEVPSSKPIEMGGTTYIPKSRTFIPARMSDNPYIPQEYQATLDSMKEPLRSAIRDGNFMAARIDEPDQLIPTAWIREAQARWTRNPPVKVPMCNLAVDIAQGGPDRTVIASRYNTWFSPLEVWPGSETPGGREVAGLVVTRRRDNCLVTVDMGGGFGGATKEQLEDNGIYVFGYKGILGTTKKSRKEQTGFHNTRAEAYWALREALDPEQPGGCSMALPDDPGLFAELISVKFGVDHRGIKITTKEEVKDILQRSPDKADAVVMCWFAGPKGNYSADEWANHYAQGTKRKTNPQVIRKTPGSRKR